MRYKTMASPNPPPVSSSTPFLTIHMSTIPVFPPTDGSCLVAETIDIHWQHNAQLPMYAYSEEHADEITTISFLEFGRAAHRAAHLLRPNGRGHDYEVVAIIALADTLVYQTLTVGLMKAGLVPFTMSPRIAPAGIIHLLKLTSCHRIISTKSTLGPLLEGITGELSTDDPSFEVSIQEIPSLNDLYPNLGAETLSDAFTLYPSVSSRPIVTDVAIYLHSSGSTGPPKAIGLTHMSLIQMARSPFFTDMRDHPRTLRIGGMAVPAFHMFGLNVQALGPLYNVLCTGLFPPTVLGPGKLPIHPTHLNVLDHCRRTKCNALKTVPLFLQLWSQSTEDVLYLASLEHIGTGGGPLPQAIGDKLVSAGVKLRSLYGATEFGLPVQLLPRPGDEKDWEWFEISDTANVRWVPQGDGTCECQFLTVDTHALLIENLPDVRGYATSDLFINHPTKPYLWKIVGRLDDVLIHSSGEKTVPGPIEASIMASPLVHGAIVFGHGRDNAGILIEANPSLDVDVNNASQLTGLRDQLWDLVDEANTDAPAYSRIFKDMIIIVTTDKPLPRTAKSTIMRKAALKLYEREIDDIYELLQDDKKLDTVIPPKSWSKEDVVQWLLIQALDITSEKNLSMSDDLFEQGCDSLGAVFLRARLINVFSTSSDLAIQSVAGEITTNTVYDYPTIEGLATFICGLVEGLGVVPPDHKAHETLIEEMVQKYSAGLEVPIPAPCSGAVVLLTGSTGSLGAQILFSLLVNPGVDRVYAFNRPSSTVSILERHRMRFEDKELDPSLLGSEKLVFVEGDSHQDHLGISDQLYNELKDSLTIVIHTAWRLDFNLSLASFENSIRGSRNLIDLARSSRYGTSLRFIFTSSIGSAQAWDPSRGPYPQKLVMQAQYAVGDGYGEGKYVVERILSESGLNATSLRIGQISGDRSSGAWSMTEWLPILVKSSLALGALPDAHGARLLFPSRLISWIPMNTVSDAILDLSFAENRLPTVLNIVHPEPTSWSSMIRHIRGALTKEKKLTSDSLPIIPFGEWFSRLEVHSSDPTEQAIRRIPAIKLIDTFRRMFKADCAIGRMATPSEESFGFQSFETDRNIPAIRHLTPLEPEDAERWVRYWIKSGL